MNEISRQPDHTVAELASARAPVSTRKTRPTIMERGVEGKILSCGPATPPVGVLGLGTTGVFYEKSVGVFVSLIYAGLQV